MSKRIERIREGRRDRLRAEVYAVLDGKPVRYCCVYLPIHQANEYRRGWDSVSPVDIDLAVMRAKKQRGITYFQQHKERACHS